ncbi:MAG: sugar phosphate isomerase/epimerase [Kiritimatiellae bacterium]|nr:sugar phosphate isomerase/epimerase [Kiritimatiellia bacterium]
MLLSTQTDNVFAKCGIDEGLKIFAAAGYDALDYSMFGMTNDDHFLNNCDVEAFAKELRGKAEALGLVFNQAHAPFPCWRNGDEAYNAKMPARVANAIRIAGILGAKSIVVHPIAYIKPGDAQKTFNFDFYRSIEPVALEYGTKIALENMWGYDNRRGYIMPNVCSFGRDLCEYYDELANPAAYTVCLDLGHCGLVGEEPDEAIRVLGHDRLGALHIHDNDYKSDAHLLPYAGKMHWDKITAALREVGYKGDFTFEACNFFNPLPADRGICLAAARMMCEVGRSLVRQIEG